MRLTVAKNRLSQTRPIVSFSSALYKTKFCAPFSIDFAPVTCVRFVTRNEFNFTRLKQVA